MDGAARVEREVLVTAPPAEVWAALTEPDRLSAWFGAAAQSHPDGSLTFHSKDGTVRRAVIDVSDPERLLVLRWLPFERNAVGRVTQRPVTKVLFILTPSPEGTSLRVVEQLTGSVESHVLSAVAGR
jgi:uncharacterized protein YndB with AHSA1/START domain